jgi:hypothetical protein
MIQVESEIPDAHILSRVSDSVSFDKFTVTLLASLVSSGIVYDHRNVSNT